MVNASAICCVCGEEHRLDEIKHIEIKGKIKKICRGCVAAVKGLT